MNSLEGIREANNRAALKQLSQDGKVILWDKGLKAPRALGTLVPCIDRTFVSFDDCAAYCRCHGVTLIPN